MNELLTDSWQHNGCSVVWEVTLLLAALGDHQPFALRDALLWRAGGYPPITYRSATVVAGLQVCLELADTPEEAEKFLRDRIQPLIRDWQTHFPESALIFALATPNTAWSFDALDHAKLTVRPKLVIDFARALWSGAAPDASRIISQTVEKTGRAAASRSDCGGLYVRRLS